GRRRSGLRGVLGSNVAETSHTVPGIRYVTDTGDARTSRHSHRTKLQRLPVEAISRASADQRRGRCGRVGPGVCLRLYSEEDFNQRPEFTDPEIRRTNLAAVVLQMLTLRLGDIGQFPFIDPPDPRMVRDGYKLLEELGAVTSDGKLTGVGKQLARLPVDPKLGRMVLAASKQGVLEEILVIASALAVQDPRERPTDKQAQADQQHARFKHKRSDFMSYLNLWVYYEEQRQTLSQNQLRKLCKREFLAFMRMREWRDVHRQLRIACKTLKLSAPRELEIERYDDIHKALLSGLLSNIAQWHEGRDFLAARNRKLQLFPGSVLAKKQPKWVVAGEIVETGRVYARQVAGIDPRWALDINPELLKKHHYQPRWQARRGQVVAYERVSLYGLTISDKQSVHYGPIKPAEARELMIREGLIPGKVQRPPGFLKHNLGLVKSLEALEARTRRRDILAEEQVQFDFYDARLPDDICTLSRLQSWLKRDSDAAKHLYMSEDMLRVRDPGGEVGEQFPDSLRVDDLELRLSYEFEPGGSADGVSITVPVALLNRVPRLRLDWLVPGMLREKCIALVKGLPKEKRKHLVPVPDFVDRALMVMTAQDTDLLQALAEQLSVLGREKVLRSDLAPTRLDDYYRMNVRVVDVNNKLIAQGRDFPALATQFQEETQRSIANADTDSPAQTGIVAWDFDEVPEEWRFRQAGVDIVAYPALVDHGQSVAIELCDYPEQARRQHRLGVLKLLRLGNAQSVKYLRKQLLRGNDYSLLLARAKIDREELIEDLVDAAFVQSMHLDDALPSTRDEYARAQTAGRPELVNIGTALEALMRKVLEALGDIRQHMTRLPKQAQDIEQDMQSQLKGLLQPAFLRDTPAEYLRHYPRYFKGLLHRLERLSGQLPKDQKHTALLTDLNEPLAELLRHRPYVTSHCAPALAYRWQLEELRVSLFAQNLGTKQAVSEKRLRQKWAEVKVWLVENPT
ncbi:MAG: ATP-dependent RNA helicase HrpA, partial [Halioglobus sp.]